MSELTSKTCCCCGNETFPQPQDSNQDEDYGFCLDCLKTFGKPKVRLRLNDAAKFVDFHTDGRDIITVQRCAQGNILQVNMINL
jgi:hypothetical protein